ncbi:MAG: UDP-3-O-acyl-N-acetylglucosamine deacetylase [Planctomycetia bacterium]|nr:UDP-3-O-acyl-N-acetylglucosamine deacetylase [Planctomycetia bacterium]
MGMASAYTASPAGQWARRPRQTLKRTVVVSGRGYWSGQENRVELRPAGVNAGIVFVRDDLGGVRVPATVACRVEASSRTNLQAGVAMVEMVEHLLSSLAGLGVDCCEVGLTAAELPGLDGSAAAYVEAIDQAGIASLDQPINPLIVTEPISIGEPDSPARIEAMPPTIPGLSVSYDLEYPGQPIPPQQFGMAITPQRYRSELAAARTFLPEEDARRLQASGRGLTVSTSDLLVFGPTGPIGNTLHWPDECARHKALDVVGDLVLAGRPIWADVRASRSGHRLNAALVAAVLAADRTEPILPSAGGLVQPEGGSNG